MPTAFTELTISNIAPGSSAYLAYDVSSGFRLFQTVVDGSVEYLRDITSASPPSATKTLADNAIVRGNIISIPGTIVAPASVTVGRRYKILTLGDTPTTYATMGAITTTAGAFEIGRQYVIRVVGDTNYTLIGASANTVGVIFTATGPGIGTGTAYEQYFTPAVTGSGSGTVVSDFSEIGAQVGQPIKVNGIWCNITSYISDRAISIDRIVNINTTTGKFVVGQRYKIVTVGDTNFTAIGASSNTVGVEFVATGVGGGTTGVAAAIGITYPSYYPNVVEDTIIGLISVISINATAIELGKTYQILTVGNTDFVTSFGAANNTIGTEFTSNAAGTGGSGTGTVTYYTIERYFTAYNTTTVGSLLVAGTYIGEPRIDSVTGLLYTWDGSAWIASSSNSRTVNLTATSQVFTYDSTGSSPTPASVTLTATATNTSGTVFYDFLINDVSQQNTTTNTYVLTAPVSIANTKVVVKLREGTNTSAVLGTDQTTIIGVQPGASGTNPVVGYLTNENHTVAADSAGASYSLVNAGGTFNMFSGITNVTTTSTFAMVGSTDNGTTLTKTQNGLTFTLTKATGAYALTGTSPSWNSDLEIFTVTGTFNTVTVTQIYTITKAKAGSNGTNGTNAIIIDLVSEADVVFADNAGAGYALPTGNSIKLYSGGTLLTSGVTYGGTATKNGLTATINSSTGTITLSGASPTWNSDQESFDFTATYNTVTYTATYTIAKSKAGDNAVIIDLVSEADVVFADNAGAGYALPTGNSIKLYSGGTLLTSGVTYGGTATKNGLTATINSSTGTITLSGASPTWNSNQESFDFTATYNTVTYTATYTIAKSRTGAAGLNNARITLFAKNTSAVTPPAAFSGTFTYTFSTNTLGGGTLNGWSTTAPSITNGEYLWARFAIASSNTDVDNSIPHTDFSAAVVAAIGGTNGTNGTNGAPAISITMDNVACQLWAYADGTVVSFAQAVGAIKVYDGSTEVTNSCTFSASASGCTGTVNTALNTPVTGARGTYRVTAMSADQATLTITITYLTISYIRVFALAKSRGGYEIVGSLPGDNLFNGRIVFLTTDNKLYSYKTGTGWVNTVNTTDLSGQISDSQISGLSAAKLTTQITTTQITDNAITTAKIGAGQVVTNSLAANSIIASKLVLTNNDNLMLDSNYEDATYHTNGSITAFAAPFNVSGHAEGTVNQPRRSLWLTSSLHYYNSKQIPLEQGASYRVRLRIYRPTGVTGFYCTFFYFPGVALTLPGATAGDNPSQVGWPRIDVSTLTPNTWLSYTATVTASTAYDYGLFYHTHNSLSGNIFAHWEITRAASADLVVDGAISAAKIATNAITADKVEAGAITAAKINVTNLSAISATIGTLRTATTGARTEIKDNLIEVYDSSGTLRVRMGIWT